MKNLYILAAIVLAALAAGACSVKENPVVDETLADKGKVVTLVATLGPKGGADTKALTDPGDGTLASAWAVNEEIEVLYEKSTDPADSPSGSVKATVVSVDGSGNATITASLTSPKEGDTGVYFHYPYCIAAGTKDLKTDQIGTLADISSNFDEVTGDGTLNVSGGVATLPANVAMTRNVSIWKFSFTNGGTPLTGITALNIKVGDIREIDVKPTTPLDEVYVAMYACSDQEITVTAATATGTYSYSKTGVSLVNGKFYRSTVVMAAAAASGTYREYSDRTNFKNVAIPGGATTMTSGITTWAAGTYVVSGDVTITEDVHLTGDVNLILKDGAELTVNGCIFGGADYDHGFIYKLNVYGQTWGTGKLTVDYSGSHSLGVVTASELNIHGGIITVGGTGVWQGLEPNVFNVYHGTINATAGMNAICAMGNTHIYGGTITAHSTTTMYGGSTALLLPNDGTTLTISGGTITAISDEASGIETVYNLVISGGTISAQGGPMFEGIMVYGTCTISGGDVTARAGENGIGLEGTITINGGNVTAVGGDAIASSNSDGRAGIDGTLTVTGGCVTATGGAKDGTGADGPGISDGSTIALTGVTMYEGDAANPATPAADQTACTKRYVIIQ